MKLPVRLFCLVSCLASLAVVCGRLAAQEMHVPKVVPVPPLPQANKTLPAPALDPQDPPPQNFRDPALHLYFHLGPGWRLERKDGELSSFHLDARTAPSTSRLRAVAMLAFNPYPRSTFSGAMLYLSTTAASTAQACEGEVRIAPEKRLATLPVAGKPFWRGLDEHGKACTEARVVTYTALRKGVCLRFDLVVNTVCGGEVSGLADMTDQQLARVFRRLEQVLETVEFR